MDFLAGQIVYNKNLGLGEILCVGGGDNGDLLTIDFFNDRGLVPPGSGSGFLNLMVISEGDFQEISQADMYGEQMPLYYRKHPAIDKYYVDKANCTEEDRILLSSFAEGLVDLLDDVL